MSFFVIEGDNGTGKDTLAVKLQSEGFTILTYDKRMREMEKIAKTKKGKDRILNFMAYNKACGDLARQKRQHKNVLLIRYFISTLAAAYSDGIFSHDETLKLLRDTYSKFEKPDLFIRLQCDQQKRIKRIEERNSMDFDDKTVKRAVRYRWITDEMKKNMDIKWVEIDTSDKSIDDVYAEVKELLDLDKHIECLL